MKKYYIYILAIVSGFIISLPFSYPHLYLLSWVGLIPFLYALIRESKARYSSHFIAGTLLGTTIIFSSSFWLYYPLVEFSGLPLISAILLFLLVFILFGLIYGIWAYTFVYLNKQKGLSPFWLAISWTAFEYLRFRFIPALPFGFIAYTQREFSSLVQFAEYGGIYLVVFIVMLINGYVFKTITNKKGKYLVPIVFILIIIISVGTIRVNKLNEMDENSITVGVVQSNLTPNEKWSVANIENNYDYFIEQSQEIQDALLVVWPESSLTFDLIRNEFYRERFYKSAANIKQYIQAGSLAIADGGLQKYNSSFLLGPGSKVIHRYNKNFLVPFGEYMPMSDMVEKFTGISISSELAGKKISIFQIDGVKWKTLICSEILYPGLVREKNESVEFLVNQSNEAWYKKGNLQEQMWSAAIFRAVENRRSVLKSGNMAYGGVISPAGKNIIKRHSSQLTTFKAELPLSSVETFYQKWGDYIGYISAIIVIILVLIKIILYYIYNKRLNKENLVDKDLSTKER